MVGKMFLAANQQDRAALVTLPDPFHGRCARQSTTNDYIGIALF
jgi:hypothetical protein